MEKCRKVQVTFFGGFNERDDYGLLDYWNTCAEDATTGNHEDELRGAFIITEDSKNYCYTWSRNDHYVSLGILTAEDSDFKGIFGWLFKESIAFVGRLYEGEHSVLENDELSPFEISIIKDMLEEAKASYDIYRVPSTISFDDAIFRRAGLESGYKINDVSDIEGIINTLKSLSETADDTMGESSHGGGGLSSR